MLAFTEFDVAKELNQFLTGIFSRPHVFVSFSCVSFHFDQFLVDFGGFVTLYGNQEIQDGCQFEIVMEFPRHMIS